MKIKMIEKIVLVNIHKEVTCSDISNDSPIDLRMMIDLMIKLMTLPLIRSNWNDDSSNIE